MKIIKEVLEDGTIELTITKDDLSLKMLMGGNGDLYWQLINSKEYLKEQEHFIIDKELYPLFLAFQRLYEKIANCQIFDDADELIFCDTIEEIEEVKKNTQRMNELVQSSSEYKRIYQESGITFVSDEDYPREENNILNIIESYDKESYIIEIIKSSKERDFLDIRFRTSGSRYSSFIHLFIELYQSLIDYDFENHQIHIEEYLYHKRLSKTYSKRK